MKKLLLLVLVGCGKKVVSGDLDNELIKQGMKWDADIKILKLEVEHLKADVKRLQEDNNASSARKEIIKKDNPNDYHPGDVIPPRNTEIPIPD